MSSACSLVLGPRLPARPIRGLCGVCRPLPLLFLFAARAAETAGACSDLNMLRGVRNTSGSGLGVFVPVLEGARNVSAFRRSLLDFAPLGVVVLENSLLFMSTGARNLLGLGVVWLACLQCSKVLEMPCFVQGLRATGLFCAIPGMCFPATRARSSFPKADLDRFTEGG